MSATTITHIPVGGGLAVAESTVTVTTMMYTLPEAVDAEFIRDNVESFADDGDTPGGSYFNLKEVFALDDDHPTITGNARGHVEMKVIAWLEARGVEVLR